MHFHYYSLRLLIPTLLVLFTALISGMLYLDNLRIAERRVERDGLDRLKHEMDRLQGELAESFRAGDIESVRQKVSRVSSYADVAWVAAADDEGKVVAASRFEWLGRQVGSIGGGGAGALVGPGRIGQVRLCDDRAGVCGIYPLPLGQRAGSLRLDRFGVLRMELDLRPAKALARDGVERQTSQFLSMLAATAVLLGLFFQFTVTRRLQRLVETTGALARGDLRARSGLKGGDEVGRLGVAFDAMAERLAENQRLLSESERRLTHALDATNDGLWDYRVASGEVYFSPRLQTMLGYRPDEFSPDYAAWAERVHPDDLELAEVALRAHLEGLIPHYEAEFRMATKEGGWQWILSRGRVVERDRAGRPLRVVGTHTDITARRVAEEELLLARKVFENASEGIVITDHHNRIIDVNPAYLRITGFGRDEVVGGNPRVSSSGRHDREFYRAMWRSLEETGRWEGEIWDRRKSGEIYPKWLSISAIADSRGEVNHYVGIFTDITQQKATEERLARLAYHDALTGLPNRALFDDRLGHEIELAKRHGVKSALLFIDLDRFKQVNDTLGHGVGDELLIEVAARTSDCVRKSDTVARLGGDEFTVILTDITDVTTVRGIARQIIRRLRQRVEIRGHEIHIGASIGIAIYPDHGDDAETLIKRADVAMYAAKQAGRGSYRVVDDEGVADTSSPSA